MSMKNTFRRAFGVAMLIAVVFLFTACPREIGLGSAVDTQKPVVSITAPEADSNVGGTIMVTGTVTDDLAVKDVLVTFTSTSDSSLTPKSYPATINTSNKTWSLTVNTKDFDAGLPDSNYEITAIASDTTNKSTTATRSIQVDNTAPTVLITSPSLYGTSTNRTNYCKQIEIKGEAYDASRIQSVKVYLCDSDGTVVAGPKEADGTNTWSVMFLEEDLTGVQAVDAANQQIPYYFYAVAADQSGNTNTTFYHKADIYEILPANSFFPSMNDIGHLDQGSTPSSSCPITAAALSATRIGTGADGIAAGIASTKGYPDFTYQTEAGATILWTNFGDAGYINVGSGIFATIQPPSDNSAILLETITVSIRHTNSSHSYEQPSNSVATLKVGESVNVSVSNPQSQADASSIIEALPTGEFEITLSCDTNSNSHITGSAVFEVRTLTDAPKVTENGSASSFNQRTVSDLNSFSGPSGTLVKSDDTAYAFENITDDTFEVVARKSGGDSRTYNIKYKDDNGVIYDKNGNTPSTLLQGIIYNPDDTTWRIVDDYVWTDDDTYTYSITGRSGATTMLTRVITIDTTGPVISLVSPSSNMCSNGSDLVIHGTAMDTGSGVAAAYWCIDAAGNSHDTDDAGIASATVLASGAAPVTGTWYKFSSTTSFNNLTPNLSSYSQENYELYVCAKDIAGHFSSVTQVPFFIDSENPQVREYEITANSKTTNTGFKLAGTAWDSNELDCITVSDGTNTWSSAGVSPAVTLVKKTSDPGTAEANWNWHIDFDVGSNSGAIGDGTTTFTITVKDVAGKTNSLTRAVTVDTTAPVISGVTEDTSVSAEGFVYLDVSPYKQIVVTAEDAGTGLKGVYCKIFDSNTVTPSFGDGTGWTALAHGTEGWTGNADFTGKAEATHYIYVAAKDNAGNAVVRATPLTVIVDEQEPVITVTGPEAAGATNVTLNISTNEALNSVSPTVKIYKNGSEIGSLTPTSAGTNAWTVTVPFAQTSYTDGAYQVKVNGGDVHNRAADEVIHSIRKDKTAPAVNVIDAPPAGKTGTDALYGTTYIFRGTAKDLESGTDCAGLAKVWYVFTHDATAPADISAYTALTTTDGPWSLTMNLNAGNADAADDDDLYEGSWYLYVLAEDAAGNRTPVASAASCQFDVDMSDPALTVTVPSNAAYKTIGQTTYIKKAASGDTTFVMNGTVVETNGTPFLTVQIGEAAAAPVTLTADAAHPGTYTWTYTVTMTNANKDQLLTAAFLVTDAAGKTKDKAQQFFFDTQAPSVTITLPAENEITKNSSYSISGTVADTGAGIDASAAAVAANKAYVIKKGSSEIASGALSITGASWSAEVADLGSLEGDLKLIITIKDVLGQTTSVERSFFYDKNNPVLTETGVGSLLTTNKAFTFKGTASDTNALAGQDATGAATGAITITAVKDGGTTNVVNETVNVAADGNWSKTFTPGSTTGLLADGRYSFTVTVKDSAGRTTSKYSEVVVDTVAPVIAKSGSNTKYITTASVTDSSGNVWYKDASLTVQATVTDNNEVAVTEYAVSTTSDSDWTKDSIVWHSMTRSSTTWTGEVPVSDGDSYICIRAKDAAGNMSYISAQEHAVADLTAPFSAGVFKEAARTTVVNTILTNAAGDLELYIDTDDLDPSDEERERRGSGAAEVRVKLDSNNMREGTYTATAVSGTPGLFKLTFSAANLLSARNGTDRTVVAYADFKDVAGNRSSASPLFSLEFDTTAPVIEFTSPSSTTTVNKTITVTGKTTEVQTLESVKLYYHPATGDDVLLQTFSSENLFNWTYSLNTATYVTGTGNITLKVVAKDGAGNTGNESVTFAVDQSKDCSEITINNIAFNANAQTEEPAMSEANPKWLIGSTTIYGSVTDDDGVEKLEYSKNGTSWEEVTVNNGAFTLTLDTDGTYRIWFKVTDKAGATFTSAAAAALDRPVLKGSDGGTTADSKLYLTVDTTNPLSDVPLFSLTGADNSWTSDLLSQKIFGKDADCKTFYVRQFVYDANDIKKVEVSIDTGSYEAATLVTSGGAPVTKTIGGNTYKAYQYQVPASVIAAITVSGNHTVNIKVTDNAGMSKETNATFTVDNTAPTIAITSHADGDRVDNNFFLSGNTSDAPSNAGATNLVYLVSSSETRPSDSSWTAVSPESVGAHTVRGNLASWRVYFDDKLPLDDGYTHDKILKRILVSTSPYSTYLEIAGEDAGDNADKVVYKTAHDGHAAGTLYKELTTLYIHFKATDDNNNVSYAVRSVEFDPQGDIPTVAISYPGASGYGWVNGSTTFFTEEKLPEVGSLAYDSIENMTVSTYTPEAVTAINRTAKTITVNSTAYTYFGGVTVQGGIIRVQGTAEGLHPIDSVYIQIDPTYSEADGFQWDATGNALLPDGTTKLKDVPGDTPSTKRYPIETVTGDTKGIKVSGAAAWSFSLNRASEFNAPSSSTTRNSVAIRAIAKDNAGNISPASDVIVITIDADTPRIGTSQDLYLYQYANNTAGTGAVTASQKYVEGMWLKGEWWIKGSIEDSSDIKSIDVNGVSVINDDDTDGYKTTHHIWGETGSQTKGYIFEFKIGSSESGFGSLSYTIHAEDNDQGGSKTVTKTITVNYDNEAPELLYPYNNQGQKVSNYNIGHDVVQSNGFYTLKSTVTEQGTETASQSGFERVALYFVRPGSTAKTGTLYDPFLVKTATGNKLTINLNAGQTSDVTYADGLYWKTKTVGRDANSLSTITLSADDANIHRGGLVKIGGTIYTITQKTGTTLTISGSPVATETTANFAIAMVVDHALTESNGITKGANGYYTDVVNDDGDGMVEAVTSQGSTTYWEANINSRNIPDGKIEIHYVAFDKAGNYSCGVVGCDAPANYKGPETVANLTYDWIDADHAARVANNAPRLAGVSYGTDDNGDGTVVDDELITDLFAITGTGADRAYTNSALQTSYLLGTKTGTTYSGSVLKIKGATKIVPEIVGGNNELYYSWSVTKSGQSAAYYEIGKAALKDGSGTAMSGSDYSAEGTGSEIKQGAITLPVATLLKNIGTAQSPKVIDDGANQLFTFTIWDSTEGTEADSQKAKLEMVADVMLKDTTPPDTKIVPLYWKSLSDNSVLKDTSTGTPRLLGHIDLGSDIGTLTTGVTGIDDADDKISGSIIIEGTASDNVLLTGIYMKLYTGTNPASGTNRFVFTGADTATLKNGNTTIGQFYKVASRSDAGVWTTQSHNDSDGKLEYAFSIVTGSESFSQETGHSVKWQLEINTEKLTATAIADLKVAVLAQDRGSPTLGANDAVTYTKNTNTVSGTKTGTTMTNYNKFDVVPYITGISTRLSGFKKNNPSVYNRTALGHYSVGNNETQLIVAGYNLGGACYGDDELDAGSAADVADYYKNRGTSFVKLNAASISTSGEIQLTVAYNDGTNDYSIPTLNNLNNNNAKGAAQDENGTAITLTQANYANYAYNRQPNGDNNQDLTDDVWIDVWTLNTQAAVARDGGAIVEPVMKINPSDGRIGFAFASGSDSFCMPNGTTNTYEWWTTNYANFSNVALAYDAKGNAFGIVIGLDTNAGSPAYAGRMELMSSLWGKSATYNKSYDNFAKSGKIRLESIGIPATVAPNNATGASDHVDIYRFSSTKLAVTSHLDDQGNITSRGFYLAYYDRLSGQIRFRSGNSTRTNNTSFDDFQDGHGYFNGHLTTASTIAAADNGDNYNQHYCFEASEDDYCLIAGAESKNPTTTSTGFVAGNYLDVDAISMDSSDTDIVVIVFTDGTDMWYVSRIGGIGGEENVNKNAAGSYWQQPIKIFENVNRDCAIKADPDGGIHITAYDVINGCLRYAYMPDYTGVDTEGNSTIKTATIDSYGIAGSNMSIDIVKENGKCVPYISYFMPSTQKVKMSYLLKPERLASTSTDSLDGVDDNDAYTGVWESIIIPTASSVNDDNTSIGFYKNTAGEAQIIRSTSTPSAQTDSGKCIGNGMNTPVVAYGTLDISKGYIEVAQLK